MDIESKSFDQSVAGNKGDMLKILENGKGSRSSIFFPQASCFVVGESLG